MLDGVLLRNIQMLRSERKSGKDSQRTPLPRLYYRTNVLLSQEGKLDRRKKGIGRDDIFNPKRPLRSLNYRVLFLQRALIVDRSPRSFQ